MRQFRELAGSRHAITDLYDEQQRTFLIQYPVWLITALALGGVVVFGMTGFLGYSANSPVHQPWPLFLWFCAVLITLQISILRHQSLRRRLVMTLLFSLFSIAFIGVTYFNASLPGIVQRLLHGGHAFRFLATHAGTYAIINFGLIAVFWLDTIRRWIRRWRGLPPNPRVDLGIDGGQQADMPSMQELISGDLIAGAVLTLLLSLVFRAEFLHLFIHPLDSSGHQMHFTTCLVSWPIGSCQGFGGGMTDSPTLTFLDLMQSLIYLPLGLVILALSTTLSGLGAVGGVNKHDLSPADVPETASADKGESTTTPITVDVTTTLINTLRSAIDRRVHLLINNFALSLRQVGWPSLIFAATYGIAELSSNIFRYLHSGRTAHDALTYVLPAAGWGLLAVAGVVLSAALIVFRVRVAENTLRFLGLVGFIVLLTFWIFSLALFGFNKLLLLTNASDKHPFDPPSAPTYLSLAALIIFGTLLFIRRARGPRPAAQAPGQQRSAERMPVPVTASAALASDDPSATRATGAEPPAR